MIGASERRSAHFLDWEKRGRGHTLWPHPVSPAPQFVPFSPQWNTAQVDDGRKPTFLSSAIRRLSDRLSPTSRDPAAADNPDPDVPDVHERGKLVEYRAYPPASLKFSLSAHTALFGSLSTLWAPVSFELVGTPERVIAQFAIEKRDAPLVRSQLKAHLPDVGFAPVSECVGRLFESGAGAPFVVVEFGLAREFVLPLRRLGADPHVGVIGALEEIGLGEFAILQVIFSPLADAWRENAIRSLTHSDGSALFVNAPELLPAAKEKTASALFGAVVRVAASAETHERTWEIACNVAAALGTYGSPVGNELVPLSNDGYRPEEHALDVLLRQSRRSGMVLNAEELVGFVHVPSGEVRSPRFRVQERKTKAAPDSVRHGKGLRIGENSHEGVDTPIFLSEDQRVRHIHVIGATGTGKSTLLYNLIRQDIENGVGCTVLDPHGDLVDAVLDIVPDERIEDVVLVDPSDEEYAVGLNVLAAHSEAERNLIASDLVAVFRRLSTSWGDQLNSVLSNALLAFMESDRGGTLFDVRRFLLEPKYRAEFLTTVRDPNIAYYWRQAFPMLTGNRSVGPVVTRLDAFLSPKAIRHMVSQRENRLDFADILDSGKILLVKMPEGVIGRENSHLLGSLFVSKVQAAAMARQRGGGRRFHSLFADEFHRFLTPSLAECLSGVRKYRLGLVLAHQEMRQVEREPEVASALQIVGTRIVFRVSDPDAKTLQSGFASFEARDLQNLPTGHAVCRIERSDCDFNLAVPLDSVANDEGVQERRGRVVVASRAKYGALRSGIERAFVIECTPPEQVVKEAPRKASPMPPQPVLPVEIPPSPSLKVEHSTPANPVLADVPAASMPVCVEAPVEKTSVPPADLGRGGAQHKAIQDRIKQEAEWLGFRVAVEKEVLGGAGQIDLVLSRGEVSIACEVTVTNTIRYEFENISKCIKAGYRSIAVVGASEEKLAKLSAAVSNSLGPEAALWTSFHLPDAFIATLKKMPDAKSPGREPVRRTRGGRTVKRKVVALSPEEARAKEEEALKLMAEMMKKKSQHQ